MNFQDIYKGNNPKVKSFLKGFDVFADALGYPDFLNDATYGGIEENLPVKLSEIKLEKIQSVVDKTENTLYDMLTEFNKRKKELNKEYHEKMSKQFSTGYKYQNPNSKYAKKFK